MCRAARQEAAGTAPDGGEGKGGGAPRHCSRPGSALNAAARPRLVGFHRVARAPRPPPSAAGAPAGGCPGRPEGRRRRARGADPGACGPRGRRGARRGVAPAALREPSAACRSTLRSETAGACPRGRCNRSGPSQEVPQREEPMRGFSPELRMKKRLRRGDRAARTQDP